MHSLILGMTLSGKTTLAKLLCKKLRERYEITTIVLDPLNDPEWETDYLVNNERDFLKLFNGLQSCAIFIDESGKAVGRYNTAMEQTATIGRHLGHKCFYLTQGGTQLAPIIRNQCSTLYLFTTAKSDCIKHANEWNQPELINGCTLAQGEFYMCSRYGNLSKVRLAF